MVISVPPSSRYMVPNAHGYCNLRCVPEPVQIEKKNGCVTEATEKRATHSKYTANETMKAPDRACGIYKCFYHSYSMSVCEHKYRFEIQKIQCVIM